MSQDEFCDALEMSSADLKTALACLAPEEVGSEGARYKPLLSFVDFLAPSGTQGVTFSIRSSDSSFSRALNHYQFFL